MNCPRCQGLGHVGNLLEHNIRFKIICPKCHGVMKISWIDNIMNRKLKDAGFIIFGVANKYNPDNYVFEWGGTTYFLHEEFYNRSLNTHDKWANLIMNVPYSKENPQALSVWR
jgi:Zn-finger nucleic acid-binding protein